jgi:hypothetical protein
MVQEDGQTVNRESAVSALMLISKTDTMVKSTLQPSDPECVPYGIFQVICVTVSFFWFEIGSELPYARLKLDI